VIIEEVIFHSDGSDGRFGAGSIHVSASSTPPVEGDGNGRCRIASQHLHTSGRQAGTQGTGSSQSIVCYCRTIARAWEGGCRWEYARCTHFDGNVVGHHHDRQVRPNRDAARKVRPGLEKMQISRARFCLTLRILKFRAILCKLSVFGRTFGQFETIQRRLAWPLH
jgi:hypothetical protein